MIEHCKEKNLGLTNHSPPLNLVKFHLLTTFPTKIVARRIQRPGWNLLGHLWKSGSARDAGDQQETQL
jgi:hypothetical protein